MKPTKQNLEKQLADKQKAAEKLQKETATIRKKIETINNANKPKSIMDKVKSVKDVLKIGKPTKEELVLLNYAGKSKHLHFAKDMMFHSIKAEVLNEGEVIKMDGIQKRHYPYFYINSSGFVFNDTYFGDSYAYTASASRLALKNEALARHNGINSRNFLQSKKPPLNRIKMFEIAKSKIKNYLINKSKSMKKSLELDENTARRLYPKASPEFKELLEQNFGKEFFNQKITDRVKGYLDIMDISGTVASDDEVKIKGFDEADNKVIINTIRKLRWCKVVNEGWLPKVGENRFYVWWRWVSSGFVFDAANYVGTNAHSSSASRLCFKDRPLAIHFSENGKSIDEGIII